MNKKSLLLIAIVVCILITASFAFGARRAEEEEAAQPGIAGQFLGSLKCIFTQCGWPAIVLFILPAIAIYIWKKVFSWG
jgi:hypothetical protein